MEKIKKFVRSIEKKEYLLLALFLLSTLLFVYHWDVLRSEAITSLFLENWRDFSERTSPLINLAVVFFSYLGTNYSFIFLILPGIFWLKEKKIGERAAFTWLFAGAVTFFLREITQLSRPCFPEMINACTDGYSFPSGHIVQIIAVIGIIAYYYRSKILTALLFFMVLLVGFFRLSFGFHFLDDVLGGVLVGIATLYLAIKLIAFAQKKKINLSSFSFFVLTPLLPFFAHFLAGENIRHGFTLFFLSGFFAGIVLSEKTPLLLRHERHYGAFVGIPLLLLLCSFLIAAGEALPLQVSLFIYFFSGLLTTLVWPFLILKARPLLKDLSR